MNRVAIEKIGKALSENGLDAVLVTPSEDLRYISEFNMMQCERFQGLVIKADGSYFYICNELYGTEVESFMDGTEKIYLWHDDQKHTDAVLEAFNAYGLNDKKIAVSLSARYENLYPMAEATGCQFVPGKRLLESARIKKEPDELVRLRTASKISDEVFESLQAQLRPGISEAEIRSLMEQCFKEKQIGPTEFGGVIASGSNSALPHYMNDSRIIRKQDILLLDFGCKYQGMNADTTRTVFIGGITPLQKEVYKIVQEANWEAERRAVEGAYIPDICMAARKVIEKAGYGDYFNHRLGHGIGAYLHESPEMTVHNRSVLERGMVFTIEPGIYLSGQFGVRIEDVVMINLSGKTEVLNQTSKELRIL